MADLGFARQRTPTPNSGAKVLFGQFPENCMKMKNIGRRGGWASPVLLQMRQWFKFFILESLPESLNIFNIFLWRISILIAKYNYFLRSIGTLIKETNCDVKHWLSGGGCQKSPIYPNCWRDVYSTPPHLLQNSDVLFWTVNDIYVTMSVSVV